MQRALLPVLPGVLLSLMLAACVSSEESGAGGRTGSPQPVSFSSDPASPPAERVAGSGAEATPSTDERQRGGVTSRQDTLHASVVRKFRAPARGVRPIKRPEKPTYTIQIGAFARASNALRFEKLARSRFPDQQIFSRFDKMDKLYRISVGMFQLKKEASALRKAILQQFPKEYHDAWVIYTAR